MAKKRVQKREHKVDVNGQEFTDCWTLGSMYDDNNICVVDDYGNRYRIHSSELLKLFDGHKFKAIKKRVHWYLYLNDVWMPDERGIV